MWGHISLSVGRSVGQKEEMQVLFKFHITIPPMQATQAHTNEG